MGALKWENFAIAPYSENKPQLYDANYESPPGDDGRKGPAFMANDFVGNTGVFDLGNARLESAFGSAFALGFLS
jgi:hypothetical protein